MKPNQDQSSGSRTNQQQKQQNIDRKKNWAKATEILIGKNNKNIEGQKTHNMHTANGRN